MKNKATILHRKRTLSRLIAVQVFYQFEFFKGLNPPDSASAGPTQEPTPLTRGQISLNELKNNLIDNYVLNSTDEEKSYRKKIDEDFLQNLLDGLALSVATIDPEISALLKSDSKLEKLPSVIRQILRFGAFELKFTQDVPLKVVIYEYVDLTACFFPTPQITFVNSILENLAKKFREEEYSKISANHRHNDFVKANNNSPTTETQSS